MVPAFGRGGAIRRSRLRRRRAAGAITHAGSEDKSVGKLAEKLKFSRPKKH